MENNCIICGKPLEGEHPYCSAECEDEHDSYDIELLQAAHETNEHLEN